MIDFEIQGASFDLSKVVKYLGVWPDAKLIFAEHVNLPTIKEQFRQVLSTHMCPQ